MARSPQHRPIGPVLGALTLIAGVAWPVASAAREPAQVQVQRSRATLAMADRPAGGLGRTSRGSLTSVTVVRSRGVRVMRGSADEPAQNRAGIIDDVPAPWTAADTMISARDYPALYVPAPENWAAFPMGLNRRGAALAARMDYALPRLSRLAKVRRSMLQQVVYLPAPRGWTAYRGPAYGNVAHSLAPALSAR